MCLKGPPVQRLQCQQSSQRKIVYLKNFCVFWFANMRKLVFVPGSPHQGLIVTATNVMPPPSPPCPPLLVCSPRPEKRNVKTNPTLSLQVCFVCQPFIGGNMWKCINSKNWAGRLALKYLGEVFPSNHCSTVAYTANLWQQEQAPVANIRETAFSWHPIISNNGARRRAATVWYCSPTFTTSYQYPCPVYMIMQGFVWQGGNYSAASISSI